MIDLVPRGSHFNRVGLSAHRCEVEFFRICCEVIQHRRGQENPAVWLIPPCVVARDQKKHTSEKGEFGLVRETPRQWQNIC